MTVVFRGIRTADAVGQLPELLGVVQHFNALRVGVVAHREGPWDGACKLPVEKSFFCVSYAQ